MKTRMLGQTNLSSSSLPVTGMRRELVEHCSANAEAMGWNPAEVLKSFFGLNGNYNCDDHISISYVSLLYDYYFMLVRTRGLFQAHKGGKHRSSS